MRRNRNENALLEKICDCILRYRQRKQEGNMLTYLRVDLRISIKMMYKKENKDVYQCIVFYIDSFSFREESPFREGMKFLQDKDLGIPFSGKRPILLNLL